MNKDLYIKEQKEFDKNTNLTNTFHCLKEFIEEEEKIFKRKESIEALKSIKEYLTNLQKELLESNKEYQKIHKELACSCNHEVAIREGFGYHCLICYTSLGKDIPKESLISIDTNGDYITEDKILKIFEDVVHSDKDLVETLGEALEELQYDSKIKVYRR